MVEPADDFPDRDRLLGVVLTEQLRPDDGPAAAAGVLAADAAARDAAWRRAAAAEDQGLAMAPARWWMAAAALLGVFVVAATMWSRVDPSAIGLRRPQEPAQGRETKPRDRAHFLELLGSARALRLRGSDTLGATFVNTADGSYDRLDVAAWPEVLRIEGERLAAWREAIAASATRLANTTRLGTMVSARFELPDGSDLVTALSVGDEVFLDVLLEPGIVRPNDALRALITDAHAELARQHRRAAGIARDAQELAALPAAAEHVECPWLADGSLVEQLRRFQQLRSLRLRDGEGDGVLAAAALPALRTLRSLQALDLPGAGLRDEDLGLLGSLPSLQRLHIRGGRALTGAAMPAQVLRELTFERCQGLTAAGLRQLRQAREMQVLRLLDCDLGASGELLAEVPSLPNLRRLVLRGKSIPPPALQALLRTKLQSLQLVDVPVTGRDLAPFAGLPTLRELAVLAPTLDDGAIQDLAALRQLTGLRLQNVKLSRDGLQELAQAMPKCTIDCVPGRRLFDSGIWILP